MSLVRSTSYRRASQAGLTACEMVCFLFLATSLAADEPVFIRQVFVPAGEQQAWPRSSAPLIPIEAGALETLIQQAGVSEALTQNDPKIEVAEFLAQQNKDLSLSGQGSFEVQIAENDSSNDILFLNDTSLAIQQASWQSETDQPADDKPAELGTWHRPGRKPFFGIRTSKSGKLRFHWRAEAGENNESICQYNLRLPQALVRRLVLDLSPELRPEVEGGVIVESTVVGNTEAASSSKDVSSKDVKSRRWKLALPSTNPVVLKIINDSHSQPIESKPWYREYVTYTFGPRGIDIENRIVMEVDLEPGRAAPGSLTFPLESNLQLTSVMEGETALDWNTNDGNAMSRNTASRNITSRNATANGNGKLHATVHLPARHSAQQRTITLKAWTPLMRGLERGHGWRPPRLRPAELEWSAGNITVVVPEGMPLLDIAPVNPQACVQTSVRLAESPIESSIFSFVQLESNAQISVTVGQANREDPALSGQIAEADSTPQSDQTMPDEKETLKEPSEIRIGITADRHQIRAEYQFQIPQNADATGRCRIAFNQPTGNNIRWTNSATGTAIHPTRISRQQADLSDNSSLAECWDLILPATGSEAQTISATIRWTNPSSQTIPLACLVDADNQQAYIVIQSEENDRIGATVVGMNRVLPPLANGERNQHTIHAFRYQPETLSDDIQFPASNPPSLTLPSLTLRFRDGASASSEQLVQWLELTTTVGAGGRLWHIAKLELSSTSSQTQRLQLPPGSELSAVEINDRVLTNVDVDDTPHGLAVELNLPESATVLSVRYSTPFTRFGLEKNLSPPLPIAPDAILAGRWHVFFPKDLQVFGAGSLPHQTVNSWQQRLLGPLGLFLAPKKSRISDQLFGRISEQLSENGGQRPPEGWSRTEIPFGPDGPEGIRIVSRNQQRVWAWILFLGGAAASLLLTKQGLSVKWLSLAIAMTGTAAILAILLPIYLASIASAMLFGLLAGMLLRFVQRFMPSAKLSMAPVEASSSATTALITGSLLVAFSVALVSAEEAANPSQTPIIHSVFIPVDEDKAPIGTKHFVTTKLLGELNRRAKSNRPTHTDWLIRGAVYSAQLDSASAPLNSSSQVAELELTWTAVLRLEVFAHDVRVTLPFQKDQANWASKGFLDGLPVAIQWSAKGDKCFFQVPEPGIYQFRISLEPVVDREVGQSQIELSIPQVADAQLRISSAVELANVELVAGVDVASRTIAVPQWEGTIGNANRLQLRWKTSERASVFFDQRVDQLLWLHIGRAGVELRARFSPVGIDQPLTALVLQSDQPLVLVDSQPATDLADQVNLARREFLVPSKLLDSSALPLRFTLDRTPQFGRIRIPQFRTESLATGRRRLAITCDPTLQFDVARTAGSSIASSEEFGQDWGATADLPPRVYELASNSPTKEIVVGPRKTKPSVEEISQMVASNDSLKVVYSANVVPGSAKRFRQKLSVPLNLAIADIQVIESGNSIPVHWTRSEDDSTDASVTVLFSREIAGRYQLVLQGDVPLSVDGSIAVPIVHSRPDSSANSIVSIYRSPDALVEVEPGAGLKPIVDAELVAEPIAGAQHVGMFTVEDKTAKAFLSVILNHSNVVGDSEHSPQAVVDDSDIQLQTSGKEAISTTIPLADIRVLEGATGQQLIQSDFIVRGGHGEDCQLRLPDEQQLLGVTIGSTPYQLERLDKKTWRLPIPLAPLPQRVQVVSLRNLLRSSLPNVSNPSQYNLTIERPLLIAGKKEIEVDLVLWSLSIPGPLSIPDQFGSRSIGELHPGDGAAIAQPFEHALLRLSRLSQVAAQSTPVALALPDPDGTYWATNWQRFLRAAEQNARQCLVDFPANAPRNEIPTQSSSGEQLQEQSDRIAAWKTQFETLEPYEENFRSPAEPLSTGSEWAASLPTTYFIADGGTHSLSLTRIDAHQSESRGRKQAALAIGALTLALVWGVRKSLIADFLTRGR